MTEPDPGNAGGGKCSFLRIVWRIFFTKKDYFLFNTRDIVEGEINIGGLVLKLIDTAGVRETEDVIEQIGVEKSKKVLSEADLVILVLDNSQKLNDVDIELLELSKNKRRIIVVNKKDLPKNLELTDYDDYIYMSSYDKNDIELLETKIKELCNITDALNLDGTYIGNARQIGKLKEAKNNLNDAIASLKAGMPIDIANIDINNAWINLGEILGEVSSEELIDELFSRFCLGK